MDGSDVGIFIRGSISLVVLLGILFGFLWILKREHQRSKEKNQEEWSTLTDEEWIGETDDDFGVEEQPSRYIPSHVRREVWRRDWGRCVNCGSRRHLEYDHIIPVSRGGSNTSRNIELLCEECNREKSNRIR